MENNSEASAEAPEKRKGRPPKLDSGMVKTTMLLDPEDAEWAKTQPGGLSGMVRRMLAEAHAKAKGKQR